MKGLYNLIAPRKAAEDSRTPGGWRVIAHSFSKRVKCMGRQNRAPASWSAAVLCRFLWPRCHDSSHHIQQPFSAVASILLTSSPTIDLNAGSADSPWLAGSG